MTQTTDLRAVKAQEQRYRRALAADGLALTRVPSHSGGASAGTYAIRVQELATKRLDPSLRAGTTLVAGLELHEVGAWIQRRRTGDAPVADEPTTAGRLRRRPTRNGWVGIVTLIYLAALIAYVVVTGNALYVFLGAVLWAVVVRLVLGKQFFSGP